MGKLIYSMITSVDGYVSDPDGNFGWATPDEEAHQFIGELSRSIRTYLYGRRIYETMVFWETAHQLPEAPPFVVEYANLWRAADKVVYSATLDEVASERTRIERTFDPDAVRKLKAETELDLSVNGPHLAAQAIRAGLVDEFHPIVGPAIVGGGNRFLPGDVRVDLELLDEHRFRNGMIYLRYGVKDTA